MNAALLDASLLSGALRGLAQSTAVAAQQNFLDELRQGGAVISPIPFGQVEELGQGAETHPFFELLPDFRALRAFSPSQAALWRCDLGPFRGDSKAREACAQANFLMQREYFPGPLRMFAKEDESLVADVRLVFGGVHCVRPRPNFRLVPVMEMPSLDGLASLLGFNGWAYYAGTKRQRIHGYWTSAYGVAVHDIQHYLSWKHWRDEDRRDSPLVYGALKSVLYRVLPPVSSLIGRLAKSVFFGDSLFFDEITALDECLSGPPVFLDGSFPYESLRNVASCLKGKQAPFYEAVKNAFARHPREDAWVSAVQQLAT